ncbi:L-lactate permease, partial [Roseomonas sp. 18066]|uniref:L-lactate permease n=1 Tax=Roseomonas sp. 18066 TaxID=2681412 RepID=UPI00135786DE
LGPGTALGAALIGLPAQQVALATAWPHAVWLLCLAPVLWRLCRAAGIVVPPGEKLAQYGMMVLMAALLLAVNLFLPFEVAGIIGTGVPLLYVLWRLDPPRGAMAWRRALLALAPWAGLTAALLLARSWQGAPALRPFAELPALPITHVAVVLWVFSLCLLLVRPGGGIAFIAAMGRARRPALAMLLYVLLGRWLAGAGIAASLAEAAAAAMGPAAAYAMPVLGLVSGAVTGSNVGSNAALMPVQAALGRAAGLPLALAAGLHNFTGAAAAGMSFAVTAMVSSLAGGNARPGAIWRLLLPSILAVLLIGWATLAVELSILR